MALSSEYEELIARFLNGVVSNEEKEELLRWVNESPENQKSFLGIKDVWDASLKTSERGTDELVRFYKNQLQKKKKITSAAWISGWAAAAVLVIGLLLGGVLHDYFGPQKGSAEKFMVPKGSKSQVVLTDGTIVNLNSDSELLLCENFSESKRELTLKGEGFFEVKSDKSHPFLVKTDKFDIKVTGTKFNVSSYANDQKINATLTEGEIQLSTKNHKIYQLKPGDKISFNQASMEAQLEKADLGAEQAWVGGEFIFTNIPFPDLINRLERWYDVKLVYSGTEFNEMVYSGKFKNQETIWQVLDALTLTTPVNYTKTNFREFNLSYRVSK